MRLDTHNAHHHRPMRFTQEERARLELLGRHGFGVYHITQGRILGSARFACVNPDAGKYGVYLEGRTLGFLLLVACERHALELP